jgi:hypothetical protein
MLKVEFFSNIYNSYTHPTRVGGETLTIKKNYYGKFARTI